jgi:hypothetical protein
MTIMDIIFNKEVNKYQLVLPENVIRDLNLKRNDGSAVEIFHDNKMSLEWLYKDIEQRHMGFVEVSAIAEKRKKRKLIVFAVIFSIALLAFIFNPKIADLSNYPIYAVKLICITVLILSGWSIFQILILGGTSGKASLMDNFKTLELQETILEKYGR